MKLHKLSGIVNHKSKRVGRGTGSGKGKTSGRGTKGQKARSGHNIPRRFEGGQSSIIQRAPKKRGFRSVAVKPAVVNINLIEKTFKDGEVVSVKTLVQKNIIDKDMKHVKILGVGKLTKKLIFRNCLFSKTAKTEIDKISKK